MAKSKLVKLFMEDGGVAWVNPEFVVGITDEGNTSPATCIVIHVGSAGWTVKGSGDEVRKALGL